MSVVSILTGAPVRRSARRRKSGVARHLYLVSDEAVLTAQLAPWRDETYAAEASAIADALRGLARLEDEILSI